MIYMIALWIAFSPVVIRHLLLFIFVLLVNLPVLCYGDISYSLFIDYSSTEEAHFFLLGN